MSTITSSIPPPSIQSNILEKILLTCTRRVPLYDLSGNIYIQIDGILMGSPPGSTISEFYMSHTEDKISKTIITKPKISVNYVDNIFITTPSDDEIPE